MNFIAYLHTYTPEELESIRTEVISILTKDKEMLYQDNSIRFVISRHSRLPEILRPTIDIAKEIELVINQLTIKGDITSLVSGVLQLVKLDLYTEGHLKSASFYTSFKTRGYLTEVSKLIKLPY